MAETDDRALRPAADGGALAPAGSDHPRDEQHGDARVALGGHHQRPRHVLRHPHLRPPADLRRGGDADPRQRAGAHDPADHRALRRREGGRCLLQQQPLSRGDAPRGHDSLRAGLRRRRAALLGALALAPRRCRRAGAHHLPALCRDALSGGRALPLRADPGGARGQGRHRAHRPAEDPRAARLVRRLPRPGRRLPDRRAQAEGAGRALRHRDRARLRRGLDGLRRAPGGGGDPRTPRRHLALHLQPRPDPRRRGGRHPDHGRRSPSSPRTASSPWTSATTRTACRAG